MKKYVRLLSLLLTLILLTGTVAGLSSCNPRPTDGSESESESNTDPVTKYSLELVKDGRSDFVIIVPTDEELFTQDMVDAVNQLITAFKSYTGATIEYTSDFVGWDKAPDDEAFEILIGSTNRRQSAAAVEGMGESEYVIKADGNKLVINGVGAKATVSAINYFIVNMLKGNKSLSYGITDGSLEFTSDNDYRKESSFFIKTIKLLGESLSGTEIVYPEGGYAEEYFATLLKKHIVTYSGISLEVVSDKNATAKRAILIGKTNRTTISAETGKYNIEVTDKGLEIVTNDVFSYIAVSIKLQTEIFKYTEPDIDLQKGQKWSGASRAPANLRNDSDVRIMYHNVWGYLNADQQASPNPTATRLKVATAIYAEFAPDVIGFQEMETGREDIENWLSANGYEKKADFHGNPIWYNTSTLECLDSGSEKVSGHRYNTMWCIFKVKATGKVFGITNSHFTANGMVAEGEGDAAREEDAGALLDAVAAIRASVYGGEDIPIFSGGDFNTKSSDSPYRVLTAGGLKNVREIATVATDIACHHNAYTYDSDYGIFMMPAAPSEPAANAIDHIMLGGNKNAVTVDEYDVVKDMLTASTSDHSPHFADFSFN